MADRDEPKKTSRSPAKKTPRKPAARRSSPAKPASRAKADPEDTLDQAPDESGSFRPVAVAGTPTMRFDDDAGPVQAPTGDAEQLSDVTVLDEPGPALPDDVEHPMRELGVGALALALAVLTVLPATPWYRAGAIEATGWSSGAWGPVVLGLSLAALAIVVLRRLGVALVFPIHHSLILEGIGWASVALLLLKRFMAPHIGAAEMAPTVWLTASLIVGLLIALAGGTVSQGVAVVTRPGWLASRAGKLGSGILAVALLAGGVFGFLNDVSTGIPAGLPGGPDPQTLLEPGYPACAENVGVPIPDGVEAVSGPGADSAFCLATLRSDQGTGKVLSRYVQSFRAAGWTIRYDSRKENLTPLNQVQAQSGQDCASVTITKAIPGQKGSQITLVIGPPNVACALRERIKQQQNQDGEAP